MRSVTLSEMKTKYIRKICPAYEIGKSGARRFYIYITLTDDVLTLSGKWHSYGQIADDLSDDSLIPADGFEYSDILKIQSIWERWHLNDMRAGTPKQEAFIREWRLSNKYSYNEACKALNEAGLLIDNGYRYGTSWLKEEVPKEVIKYLFSLPAISGDSWLDIEPVAVDETEFFNIINVGATKPTVVP